jgi:hypothetical protein
MRDADWAHQIRGFEEVYAEYFSHVTAGTTTSEQIAPADQTPDKEGHYPDLKQVSVIGTRPAR